MTRRPRKSVSAGLSPDLRAYLAERQIDPGRCKPLIRTPEPTKVPGAWFDAAAVDRVLRFFSLLRHIKGSWAGRPFVLEGWQVAYIIGPIFGWKHPDGTRITRAAWIDLPRKSGKSAVASGISLYLLTADREAGAEIYNAAGAKDQARIVFDPAAKMASRSPQVDKRVLVYVNKIVCPSTDSQLVVLAADADLQMGLNVHGAVIDEVHVHKSRDLIDTLETGTGARDQPLIFFITTADDGTPNSIYDEKRTYTEKVAKGLVLDPTHYGVVFAAPEKASPFLESTWVRANPGIDVTVKRDYLRKEAAKAKSTPAYLNVFLRLHLNRRVKQATKWHPLSTWDACATKVNRAKLVGRRCFGGLDLATSTDIAALAWDFPNEDGSHTSIYRFWLPTRRLEALNERTAGQAAVWVRQRWLTLTPGDVIDYEAILGAIKEDGERYQVVEVAYDRWGMAQMSQMLVDEGLEVFPMSQNMSSMSPPTKEWERLILQRQEHHDGNPVMRWMFDNIAIRTDSDKNIKIDKKLSAEKVDGPVARVMALDRALRHEDVAAPVPRYYGRSSTAG